MCNPLPPVWTYLRLIPIGNCRLLSWERVDHSRSHGHTFGDNLRRTRNNHFHCCDLPPRESSRCEYKWDFSVKLLKGPRKPNVAQWLLCSQVCQCFFNLEKKWMFIWFKLAITDFGEWLDVRGTELGAKWFSSDYEKGHCEEKKVILHAFCCIPWLWVPWLEVMLHVMTASSHAFKFLLWLPSMKNCNLWDRKNLCLS